MDINKTFEGIENKAKLTLTLDERDYIGADGLRYCYKCGTAKQCRITVPFLSPPERIVYCLCKCQKEKQDEEEKRLQEIMRKDEIERNRQTGIKDTKILQYTFEKDEDPNNETSVKLRNYCKNHEAAYNNNMGLLLYGECGTGKSFYAGCIANRLIDSGVKVLCTTIPKILNELFSVENKNAYINDITSYPFLIIDDLGTERSTDYAMEQLFTVIDERYKSNKPTIITTNLTPTQMQNADRIEMKRIYDRISEMCLPFKVTGNSKRAKASYDKFSKSREIFN